MSGLLNSIGSVIWGAPMLVFFLGVALYYSFRSRFFQVRGIKTWTKETVGSLFKSGTKGGGISQFGAFCSVLAACIGTGNIVGVATAIYSGGPGAVFWMWISAVISMMTAYTENYLGIKYKTRSPDGKISGGAHQYMEHGVKMKGMAKVYAVLCIFSTLGMGDMAQANSVTSSLESEFHFSKYITGAIMTLLCLVIISGGVKRISKFSEFTVPLMSVSYIILSAAVLFSYRQNILPSISIIFKEAFSFKALSGYGAFKAMRYGISRGVFSNEAGLGSSTIIHSQTNETAENQGMWAMFEVFCDTVLLCTVMALVILVSGIFQSNSHLYGAELSIASYSVLGKIGTGGIAVLTAVFAFASLTGCSFYGEKSAEYLLGNNARKTYRIIYIAFSFIGSVTSPETVWAAADIFNGLMAVPNLFSLVVLRNEVEYPNKTKKFSAERKAKGLYNKSK